MVRSVIRGMSSDRMLCDGLDHYGVVEYINRVDSVRNVLFGRSIVCWSVEDVSAAVLVAIKEGVSEGIVIAVT